MKQRATKESETRNALERAGSGRNLERQPVVVGSLTAGALAKAHADLEGREYNFELTPDAWRELETAVGREDEEARRPTIRGALGAADRALSGQRQHSPRPQDEAIRARGRSNLAAYEQDHQRAAPTTAREALEAAGRSRTQEPSRQQSDRPHGTPSPRDALHAASSALSRGSTSSTPNTSGDAGEGVTDAEE
jgi:hypothetical protein